MPDDYARYVYWALDNGHAPMSRKEFNALAELELRMTANALAMEDGAA